MGVLDLESKNKLGQQNIPQNENITQILCMYTHTQKQLESNT